MKPPPTRPLLPPPALRRRGEILSSVCHCLTSTSASPGSNVPRHVSAINLRSFSLGARYHPTLPPSLRRREKATYNDSQERAYAVQTPTPMTLQVFDAASKHQQRERAALAAEGSRRVDYLRDEVAKRLCERLLVRPIHISVDDPVRSPSRLRS